MSKNLPLLVSTLAVGVALTACAPSLGPPPPGEAPPPPPPPSTSSGAHFRAEDFSWSAVPGHDQIVGHLAYRQGATRYTCAGATVILTPETPWTRRRMHILYLSNEHAAAPIDEVRARTPSEPDADYSAFVRRAVCNGAGRFSFAGLPDGAWYVITTASPVSGSGPKLAVMRRVETRAGRPVPAEL